MAMKLKVSLVTTGHPAKQIVFCFSGNLFGVTRCLYLQINSFPHLRSYYPLVQVLVSNIIDEIRRCANNSHSTFKYLPTFFSPHSRFWLS